MPNQDKQNQGSNPLGQKVSYQTDYQPDLLFAIPRIEKRIEIGVTDNLPFVGEDIWNAYELSWLNSNGLPQVGIAEVRFPLDSRCIIESKSLKLYLNSLNQSKYEGYNQVERVIAADLSARAEAEVMVTIRPVDQLDSHRVSIFDAHCIDHQNLIVDKYQYDASLLKLSNSQVSCEAIHEQLCSHLLKSNCLITNQPDWASVYIEYEGRPIDHGSLLKYLVSFRSHNEFHEQCVERIYCDIMAKCKPTELMVYARYTRRGGLDINPWRASSFRSVENTRLSRQ